MGRSLKRLNLARPDRQDESEDRALSGGRSQLDPASEQLLQLARDVQSEAGTDVASGQARVHLGEGLEKRSPLQRADPYPRVTNRDADLLIRILDLDSHLALVGELHGIAREVDENLPRTVDVGGDSQL